MAVSPAPSCGGVGKGRRACNHVPGIRQSASKSRCKVLIGRDDISNDVITLGMCFSMLVYSRAHFCFMLIGGNLTVQ